MRNSRTHFGTLFVVSALLAYSSATGSLPWEDDVWSRKARTNREGAFYHQPIFFYDTEEKAGLVVLQFLTPLVSGRYGTEDGSIIPVTNYVTSGDEAPAFGIPYWWEATTPGSGTVRGWARTNGIHTYEGDSFMIPIAASSLGLQPFAEANLPSAFGFTIFTSTVDSIEEPSLLAQRAMSVAGTPSILHAIYLPGNSLSSRVIQSHNFGPFDLSEDGGMAGIWGANGTSPYPFAVYFSDVAPYGPLLAISQFEGTTSAMIQLDSRPGLSYSIQLPFEPLP
ncbi:MAG: hypothetical protein ABI579_06595, partial [Candidatus Sumerlaeota bacterium]